MKKTLFVLVWLAAALTTAQAQTEKGRWLVGAQVGDFSYSDQNSQRSFSGELTPSAGYFVANGLAIGAGVPLGLSTQRYPFFDQTTPAFVHAKQISLSYGLAPFVRYYFGPAKLKPYIGVSYSYSRTYSNQTTPDRTILKTKGYASSIAPTIGVAYFITRNLALNAGLNYNIQKQESQYTEPASRVGTYNSNYKSLSLGIGFQLFFGS